MITDDLEFNTHLKRKRGETVYDVEPLLAPSGFVPFFASTLKHAEWLKGKLEHEYRNRFSVKLVCDGDSSPRVEFSYPPAYLFDFAAFARDV